MIIKLLYAEPSGKITPAEIDRLLLLLAGTSNRVGGLAIMGSMPPGCPSDLYASVIKLTCDSQSKV